MANMNIYCGCSDCKGFNPGANTEDYDWHIYNGKPFEIEDLAPGHWAQPNLVNTGVSFGLRDHTVVISFGPWDGHSSLAAYQYMISDDTRKKLLAAKSTKGMFRVTIEEEDGYSYTLEYEHGSVEQRRGINRTYPNGSFAAGDLEPTGSEVAVIKLWSGCASFKTHRPGNAGA